MKTMIRNIAKRPVTIPCNTGETRHLPPNYEAEFLNAEVVNNATVEKLKNRGLIRVTDIKDKKPAAPAQESRKTTKKSQ